MNSDRIEPMNENVTNRQFALQVTRQLQQAGFEALWAGGCVRDQLLGLTPKDYDVATSALPEQVRQLFGKPRTLPIGAAFGVITVLGPKSAGQIEVATFRSDGEYADGRHPDSVQFSTAKHDALRRDFTINGLFYDPVHDQVHDYVDGLRDLESKIIRAIGSPFKRIREDKLRMLRAVRFAATFSFELESATASAVKESSSQINVVSAERIAMELRRMLVHPNRRLAVQLLRETLLDRAILSNEIRLAVNTTWPSDGTCKMLDALETDSFPVALAAWLAELNSQSIEVASICRHWKLSNVETDATLWLLETDPLIRVATQLPWPKLQRQLIHPLAADAVELARATTAAITDDRSRADAIAGVRFCTERLAWTPAELNPDPLLAGDDLIALGMMPGPHFKVVLETVRDAQLEKKISSKQQAIALAQAWFANKQ